MHDELELLREWDADAAPLTGPARDRARHRLLNAMAHADQRTGTRTGPGRRHALRLAAAAVVATAVTGTVVLIGTEGSGEGGAPRTSTPRVENAAAVLNGAAAWERKQEKGPVAPRDDQFIYSKRIIKETEQKTGKVKTYTDEMWDSVDVSKPSLTMELGREMWEEPAGKGGGVWPPRKWSELKKLPQDPEKLIWAILSLGSRGGSDGRSISDLDKLNRYEAYWLLGELLKNPVLPQGLRPAAYEALALVPGVKTIPGVKDSAGRTGVGIAHTGREPYEGKYLIFDPASYEFLGFRDERISASGKKKYIQLSHVVDWGIVDRVKQRP
ncbi:CU044_5270 family protein [Streptomyces aureoverticillatus]|uniref:CU044_5270 family protein n=1 Tax=Streptomyces aureoverticillatus TaxID=66871 RepID=UPI0013D9144D|nr:CU044_5270 family protein [Streptomyces aureoverticillatus]QIB47751.1 Tat pathway signal protein [Streptomyces aureoverticillatus]